ncbi:MAG: hypothetical protein GX337_05530 [Christensenellaceae bacterium]|nr:hypothetical protein [Christensenellaceae bacterium]
MQGVEQKDRKKLILVLLAIAVALALVVYLTGLFGTRSKQMSAKKLRCVATQRVTPFGDKVLYYDGDTLFCLSSQGAELWKYPLGSGAGFHASNSHIAAWVGANLHIIDRNGRSTYNDSLSENIQFARVGEKYVAAVIGSNVGSYWIVKDFSGISVDNEAAPYRESTRSRSKNDEEQTPFKGLMILDLDFFDGGEFLWVTRLDVSGVVASTVMNIYQVGAMNTGTVELGEDITYRVLFSGGLLNVVNTREVQQYTYRGLEENANIRRLVYGWQLIDWETGNFDARMLFAPVFQIADLGLISELRVLQGSINKRFTLPDGCVGACLKGSTICAFSSDSLYQAGMGTQRFNALKLPSQIESPITGYLGKLTNGTVLLSSGNEVYALVLP